MILREKLASWTRMTRCGLSGSKKLHALTELSKSTKAERNKFIYEKMDALACEIGALKPRDPRRAAIVNEIIRLSHLISK